jgi:glycosyltransferase involved in cell wall biosynthesis
LTEELVKEGHDVTLFASGDSVTKARLVPGCKRAVRLDPARPDPFALHARMLEDVCRRADNFDIIHFHTDELHLPIARRCKTSSLTTLHGRLDVGGLAALYAEYKEQPLVSISNAQRRPLPGANWLATVYHGLPRTLHTATETHGSYLAFLGRVAPEKGLEKAIEIARGSGIALRIAAKVSHTDQEYFDTQIAPLLDGTFVSFLGEINDHEKTRFLGDALALVFPINWPEPFGLAMVEALACGTPVIAFRHGSVPEVIEDGVNGFIVEDVAAAIRCTKRVTELSRRRCRESFEQRFQAERMAKNYRDVYELAME